jgi:putative SOS response-associated peptidase YedK
MCGKAAVSHLSWSEVFAFASSLTPPSALPADPASRINISPSRLRRKSEPDSMVWETLPIIYRDNGIDRPGEAIWPFLPVYSEGRLPMNKQGRIISTANARLRTEGAPFAPTYMGAWSAEFRTIVVVSWFYEFDSRLKPQVPYAVFPTDAPCWLMAGLARRTTLPDQSVRLTTTVITVEPNEVLRSVGHHRSPALFRNPDEAKTWLHGDQALALELLRPYENETMGTEPVDMGIKIPGNQEVRMPEALARATGIYL